MSPGKAGEAAVAKKATKPPRDALPRLVEVEQNFNALT